MNETIRMQISAYIDGELPESESELLLRRLSQDPALRAEFAEFTEIGRGMRGEYTVPGIHGLRQRVASALDADPGEEVETDLPANQRSFLKPLSGFAIAAGVALVALVSLQQTSSIDVDPATVAGDDAGVKVRVQRIDIRSRSIEDRTIVLVEILAPELGTNRDTYFTGRHRE